MIRYVITRYRELTVMASVTEGIISDLTVADDGRVYSPGDIVIAKIAEINRNRSAAFVELGDAKGYLPLSGNEMLRPGDEYPVMIKKEAQGSKDITVTGRLGIAGRYVVVELPASDHPAVHISHKIKDEKIRDALKGGADIHFSCCYCSHLRCSGNSAMPGSQASVSANSFAVAVSTTSSAISLNML